MSQIPQAIVMPTVLSPISGVCPWTPTWLWATDGKNHGISIPGRPGLPSAITYASGAPDTAHAQEIVAGWSPIQCFWMHFSWFPEDVLSVQLDCKFCEIMESLGLPFTPLGPAQLWSGHIVTPKGRTKTRGRKNTWRRKGPDSLGVPSSVLLSSSSSTAEGTLIPRSKSFQIWLIFRTPGHQGKQTNTTTKKKQTKNKSKAPPPFSESASLAEIPEDPSFEQTPQAVFSGSSKLQKLCLTQPSRCLQD